MRGVRLFPQPSNAGIVANFNRAFRLSRAEYFRWIGADDWIEPTYAEKCVALLDQHPEAIGVTTYQAHWSENGESTTPNTRGAEWTRRSRRTLRRLLVALERGLPFL